MFIINSCCVASADNPLDSLFHLKHNTKKYFINTKRLKYRSSRPEVFCEKRVLRKFTKFTGNRLCQSLFFNIVTGLVCFPMNVVKFLRTPFLTKHLRWLLLKIIFPRRFLAP